jgi:hypothetical protein
VQLISELKCFENEPLPKQHKGILTTLKWRKVATHPILFMTPGDVEAFVSFKKVAATTSPLCGFQKGFGGRK